VFFNKYDGYWYATIRNATQIYRSKCPWLDSWQSMGTPLTPPTSALNEPNYFGFSGWMTHTLTQLPDGSTRISMTDNAGFAFQQGNDNHGYALGFIEWNISPILATRSSANQRGLTRIH
jgi:hypothetical protein